MSNYHRDITSGRYDYGDVELVCTCGHKLGVHAAENETHTRPCFNEDTGLNDPKWPTIVATGESCDCLNFKKAARPTVDRGEET